MRTISAILIACILLASSLPAGEVLDRVAISVGFEVITEHEIQQQIRLTAFINRENPVLTPANMRETGKRMVQTTMMLQDMRQNGYPEPGPEQVEALYQSAVSGYADEASLQRALAQRRIGSEELRAYCKNQAAVLRYIELRFRPNLTIPESNLLEYYYNTYVPQFLAQGGTNLPAFEQVRPAIENRLLQQTTDEMLDRWLQDVTDRMRIEYKEDVFQ
jgi:hypothetical protein